MKIKNPMPPHVRAIALKLKEEYEERKNTYTEMYNYYIGNTMVKRKYPQTDRSNRVVTTNFIKKFINEETSFSVGNPVSYTNRESNNNVIQDIEFVLNYQTGALDSELMRNMLIYGTSYELYYQDNAKEFKCKTVNPLSGIAYRDVEGKAKVFLYFYKKELDDNIYIDIYDDFNIYHCSESFMYIGETTPHYFGECPVGVSELPEGIYDTLYNDLKALQDNYELVLSDYSNEVGDTRLSYLVLTGLSIDEPEAKEMKKMGIIQIPNSEGKAQWLIKNISPEFLKGIVDILEDKIYQVSQHINHNIALSSNTSGVALSSRLISLRNKICINQKSLTDCIKTRIRCLFKFLKQTEQKDYNYKNIGISYTLNIPQDDVAMAQIITQLNGKLSAETGLGLLSFVTNGKEEYEKAQKEIEAQNGGMPDLDKLSKHDPLEGIEPPGDGETGEVNET